MFLKRKDLPYIGIQFVITVLLVFTLLWGFVLNMGYYFNVFQILGISFVCFLLTSLAIHSKKAIFVSICIFIVGIFSFFIIYFFRLIEGIQSKTIQYYNQMYSSLKGVEYIDLEVQLILTILFASIISAFVYIIWVKKNDFIVLLMSTLIFFYGLWKIQPFGVYGSLNLQLYSFLIAVIYLHYYLREVDQETLKNHPFRFLLTAITFSFFLILVAKGLYNYMPDPFKPFKIEKSIGGNVAVSDEERDRERERIEAEYTYLETDESNVRLVPEFKGIDVAIVKAKQNVYLRGGVFDTFDGTHWLNRYEKLHPAIQEEGLLSIENIIESNVFEHLYAVAIKEGIELDVQPDSTLEELVDSKFSPYFYIDPIRVTNKKFLSYSLIAPLNYMNVTYREDFVYKNLTITKDGIIQSNQYTRENHVYTSSTLVPYYDTPEIQDILRKSYKGYYDNLNDRFLTHELKSRARDVYDKYLNIPDTIHPKVIQLAHTLTRDYHNDFDKVKAIEAYLKENHTYTLTPNNTQGDYVYNFLFETKEGFCTSFATAMVLMVREIGVPARYVTGFAAKDIFELYDYTYDELQQKIYTVKDHNAHAWVEVYFEGFGWVPFEPTSGFQLQDEIYEKEEKTLKIEDKNRRVNFYLPPKLQEGLIYGLLLLLCVVLPLYIRIRKVMAIKKKAVQEKFVVFYELALTLLKHRGYTRKQEETMSQFIERYRGILQEENYPLEEMNQIYEDIYYGQLTVDQEHLEKIKDFYSKTKKRSWKYGNKLKYMWLIYTAQIL